MIFLAKFNETYIPLITSLIESQEVVPKQNITLKKFILHEAYILHILSYKLNYDTVNNFLESLLSRGIVLSNENTANIEQIYRYCELILEVFITETKYLNFSLFEIAICIVGLAREIGSLKRFPKIFADYYKIEINSDLFFIIKR